MRNVVDIIEDYIESISGFFSLSFLYRFIDFFSFFSADFRSVSKRRELKQA